jgi:CelD/BcsL family acetyltransferase involved in cellulose biosynthesis
LHEQRWDGAGAFRDPRVERLHRCFAQELARRGQLWLTTLDLDGTPAAAWYGFADHDTVYFYQSGRDPRWDHESVGVVLMAMMIRRAIERGFRRFDFLRGDEAYKRTWTKARRVTSELVAFRPTWRGQWLRALDLAGRLRDRLLARSDVVPA